ncbi:cytochrome P450 [Mycolicibacterium goodii]|uniref:cytochrome P450 n=1 Tax=Mycolicibacterium goodii TaxID=134601 RepID=UPI001BDD00ED|nr:cytochrome P450 [Mycolicibacterium goodii]MBU8812521.1 cytochrome P450 [Mycolicibacterium goodii]
MSHTMSPVQSASLDPYHPAALLDPYPYYAELRAQGPVVFVPERAIWLVPGYAEAEAVLRNHTEFVSGDGVTYRGRDHRERFPLLESDPPEHNRIRRSVQPSFAKGALEALRPGIVAAAVSIADRAVVSGDIDAIQVIADPMPHRAMALLTGIIPPSCQTYVDWGDAVVRAEEPAADPQYAAMLGEALEWLSRDGLNDLPPHCLGRLITDSGGARGGLAADGLERLMTLASIWLAGIESTAALLGNAINAFIEHPDQWELLRRQPELIPNAVEELLRYEAPFRIFYRRTRAQAQVGGVSIPAGAPVGVLLASAGRDPRQFPDPDRLDLRRDNARRHLSFSTAVHQCLGAPLARMEATAMLTELTGRVVRFERAGEAVRHPSGTVRKFESLPVRLVPGRGA